MSESLLAAEEEMRAFARQMQNAPDIQNVFRPDGTGLWADGVAGMRDRLADNIQSRSARDEFKARFNQREQAMRFSLQDEIDARIKARAAAAHAARMSALEDSLSDPFNATTQDFEMAVLAVRTESDAAVRSGIATQETTRVMNAQLAKRVAERTAAAYVFDDPTRAVALAEALDLQDEVDAGRLTPEEAYARSGLSDDAAYTLFTLDAIPREQALEIIYDTLSRSNRLYEAAEAQRARVEAKRDESFNDDYRGMFFFSDPTRDYTANDVIRMAPGVAAAAGFTNDPTATVSADQVRDAFMTYFDTFNYLTPEQRRQIDTAFNRPSASSFAPETNRDVYADLFARAEAGNLTVVGLNAARGSITSDNYTTLLSKIGAEADDALNDAKRVAQLRFGYDERMAVDTDSARQAQAAYFSVASQLEQMATTRRAEGNPMTRAELNSEAERLANQQLELFRAALQGDRDQYVEFSMSSIPGIGFENPLADLEAWWASLDEEGQRSFRSDYARHKFTLLDYQSRMSR
jgi:predicted transcriptional regulator